MTQCSLEAEMVLCEDRMLLQAASVAAESKHTHWMISWVFIWITICICICSCICICTNVYLYLPFGSQSGTSKRRNVVAAKHDLSDDIWWYQFRVVTPHPPPPGWNLFFEWVRSTIGRFSCAGREAFVSFWNSFKTVELEQEEEEEEEEVELERRRRRRGEIWFRAKPPSCSSIRQ